MTDEYITIKRPSGKPLRILKSFFQRDESGDQTRYLYGNAKSGIVDDSVFCKFIEPTQEEERSIKEKGKEKDIFGFITIYNNKDPSTEYRILADNFLRIRTYFRDNYSGKEILKIVAFSPDKFYYMLSSDPNHVYDKEGKEHFKFNTKTDAPKKGNKSNPKYIQRKKVIDEKNDKVDPDSDDLFKRLLGPTNQLVTKGQVQNKLSQLYEQLSDAAKAKDGQKEVEEIETRIWKLAENMGFNPNYGLDRQSVEKWINDFKKPAIKREKK